MEIIPTKYYSSKKLVEMKILPWGSAMTFNKRLKEQYWIDIFKPIITSHGKRKFTYIQGANIINFQQLAELGRLNINNEKNNSKD